ncbi:alpha/beta fold hydrolase [Nocardia sp. 348MFTsu5.1]|uniref:alpha/beta fold hydrolase n=1 Tax=Nocardia sp. 348MFTsu5.1 TaxID=1172185 RepID=UPI000366906D|nr:alpha/beta fold hydrolase [Nocardia sp. 348MFTsu5.1]
MVSLVPTSVLDKVTTEVARAQVRARNGLKHIGGFGGSEIAVSSRRLVWQRDSVKLYRYDSEKRTRGTPLVLVHSLVTKPYVLDLRAGSSLIADFLEQGFDVYLLDWGVPQPVDAHNGVVVYCDEYIPLALEAARAESGADEVSVLGYCLGALLTLVSAAGNSDLPVRSLVLLATPIDLGKMGPMSSLLEQGRLEPEDLVDETGNVPAGTVRAIFRLIQPTAPLTTYSSLWQSLANDEALAAHNALIGWSNDHIPLPGKAFEEVVDVFIRQGLLLTGRFPLGLRTVELAAISCPVLSVVGERDNLVPPEATAPLAELLVNADLEQLILPAGHAGLFVGRQARTRCVPSIVAWLTEHS